MAGPVLPDSNYYIGRARIGIDPFAELAAHSDEGEFITCGMVILEVCRGLRLLPQLQRFQERFSIMHYVATGNSVWERATDLACTLDRRGIVLPAPDLLIAACALQVNAAMLTFDAHFRRIPGLRVLDRLD